MRCLTVLILLVIFTSCEGYYHFEGQLTDKNSGAPVTDARVIFITNGKDTNRLKCNLLIRDSISTETRKLLRKRKVWDDYKGRDKTGYYKYCDTLIHRDGSFSLASKLFNVTRQLPEARLLIIAKSYKPRQFIVRKLRSGKKRIRLE